MDADLLARFPLVEELEAELGAAVESAAAGVSAVSDAVRSTKRQLRVAKAGTQAASAHLRSAAFPGGVPATQAVIKAVVAGGAASASKAPPDARGLLASLNGGRG